MSELPYVRLIQRFATDSYFSQAKYNRLKDLLDQRASLTHDKNAELDTLIDAELDAAVARLQ